MTLPLALTHAPFPRRPVTDHRDFPRCFERTTDLAFTCRTIRNTGGEYAHTPGDHR